MAKKKRPQYSDADRQRALLMLETHTLKEVASKLGISVATLSNWKASHPKVEMSKPIPLSAGNDDVELLRLENAYLKRRLAILEGKK